MKHKLLTIVLICIASGLFAQVPNHLRVLNYVPDSCYTVTLLNLDTLAEAAELESLHLEKVLKPIYDSRFPLLFSVAEQRTQLRKNGAFHRQIFSTVRDDDRSRGTEIPLHVH